MRLIEYQIPLRAPAVEYPVGIARMGKRIVYTRRWDDVVGVLDPDRNTIVEYQVVVRGGRRLGLCHVHVWERPPPYRPQAWVGCEYGGVLHLGALRGRARLYEISGSPLPWVIVLDDQPEGEPDTTLTLYSPIANASLHTRDVIRDSGGGIWSTAWIEATGSSPPGFNFTGLSRIESFGPGSVRARVWAFPRAFDVPNRFWVDGQDRVWFTVNAGLNSLYDPEMVAMFDPRTATLVSWDLGFPGDALLEGIAGDDTRAAVWAGLPDHRGVLRFDIPTITPPPTPATVFEWIGRHTHGNPVFGNPYDVALTSNGDVWFTNANDYVGCIGQGTPHTDRLHVAKSVIQCVNARFDVGRERVEMNKVREIEVKPVETTGDIADDTSTAPYRRVPTVGRTTAITVDQKQPWFIISPDKIATIVP